MSGIVQTEHAGEKMTQAFTDSLAHLLAEMERIDLMIRYQIAHRYKLQTEDEQFRGLYISEQEVESLLCKPLGRPQWLVSRTGVQVDPAVQLEQLKNVIHERKQLSMRGGIELRLERLHELFQLTPFDIDVVLVCMAVELDLRYEKIYGYLQDDVTKKKPSVELLLNLLAPTLELNVNARPRLSAEAPLLRFHLVYLIEDPAHLSAPLLTRFVKVDDRIVQYLLGEQAMDEHVRTFTELMACDVGLEHLPLDDELKHGLMRLARNTSSQNMVVHLKGPPVTDKQGAAQAVCHHRNQRLLVVDLEYLTAEPEAGFARNLAFTHREARLQQSALFWKGVESIQGEQRRSMLNAFIRSLKHGCSMVFLDGEIAAEAAHVLREMTYFTVPMSRPSFVQRAELWRTALDEYDSDVEASDMAELAVKFKFSYNQIRNAAATAGNLIRWRDEDAQRITIRDLYEACRAHSNQKLSSLAHKIALKYRWDDIVLPQDRTEQLREICNHIKYRDRVYSEWGFDQKLAMGKGLCVLFAGPSGTGKTMSADIIAGELGLDLYKIDLSNVVSKYIGETEKNLSRIFDEAETSNAILFFDEADALFGKRSEVKDSHDRYANIETGYLLQRMEEHEGIVILASNFRKNMDEAFIRRLHFTVEFPFPNEEDRLRIWENVWPETAPRDPALDLAFLAKRFQITGGNIRNIALSAAFLAADDTGVVGMQHLIRATQREYQKMGKLVSDSDFGVQAKDVVAIGRG
ncbi:ATP-binding protein [Nitrosovibrio tenuis]|uniref:AAA+-type ATPase, SpoVK/Ycf46/Vps4 family n=1 Tax=Nitrosovibrio tenuis TaxID=1233 RepID=A0A1H7MN74_9PROT|nr:ATP-binding protein [Nitrosovibrio tenuis]SEL12318.1 AAA+-type ATPase, SpoVK/Ycf46/Vps4 family [Nitrosovibrio tenuis]